MPAARDGRFPFLLFLLLADVFLAGCLSDLSGDPPPEVGETQPTPDRPPRVVRVARPEPVSADDSYLSSLYVEMDVRVTARSSGIIERILVERGDPVRGGEPLAVLEGDLATRELEMARDELHLGDAEYERVRALYEQKIASPQEFDRVRMTRDRAASKAALAEALVERSTVHAPFDGLVVERWAVVGQRVREEDATPLFRIVGHQPLRARVDVPESRLPSIKVGARALVELSNGDSPRQPARIVFISPVIEAASGTAPVIVETMVGKGILRPGASVRIRFAETSQEGDPLVRLPREAIPAGTEGESVEVNLMVVQAGRATSRRVRVVEKQESWVMVRGAITPADQVIIGANVGLAEGDPVAAREELP